jgi:hypothetical protein
MKIQASVQERRGRLLEDKRRDRGANEEEKEPGQRIENKRRDRLLENESRVLSRNAKCLVARPKGTKAWYATAAGLITPYTRRTPAASGPRSPPTATSPFAVASAVPPPTTSALARPAPLGRGASARALLAPREWTAGSVIDNTTRGLNWFKTGFSFGLGQFGL